MPQLSIIIPFGTSKERPYIQERVIQKAKDLRSNERVEVIFVEGFSSLILEDLPSIIQENGHKYFKITQERFSQGECRNFGAIQALADVVMPLDVDYHISNENIQKVLNLIKIKNIQKNPNAILCLPVVFLNESGTQNLMQYNRDLWDCLVQEDLVSGKREWVDFFSLVSSSVVVSKHKFLEIGGNDSAFVGHSYEDHDFFMRLLVQTTYFAKMPKTLAYDGSWNFFKFQGFRSWFSLLGLEASFYGIYLYHFWHIKPNQNGYFDRKALNHKRFYANLKNFKTHSIKPLQTKNAQEQKALLLCKAKASKPLLESLRGVSVYMGEILSAWEEDFFLDECFLEKDFLDYWTKHKITYLLFPNPYSNPKRRVIYEFARKHNLPYFCFDRGALPDSWFLDNKGFNADSSSYNETHWNRTLSQNQITQTKEYIKHILAGGGEFLEFQGKRKGASRLLKKLGIQDKRVVFVPLQVESDSVILHFSAQPFDYEGFLKAVNALASELGGGIAFVAKKHPLTLNLHKKAYQNIIFAPDDTNLLDLLEACECVLTINSGVGVYAMLAQKPCILCGESFYCFKGLNIKVKDKEHLAESLKAILRGEFIFDVEKSLRFIYYLRNEFYSFGTSFYTTSRKNGRKYRKVVKINFYQIVLGGKKFLNVEKYQKVSFDLKSLIYKPYLYEIYHKNFLIKIVNLLLPNFLIVRISHTKFYRLFKKMLYNPKEFVKDSKNPLIKSFQGRNGKM